MNQNDTDGENETIRTYTGKMEFELSFSVESPPREGQKIFGPDESVELKSDLHGFDNGDYRQCLYCEGESLVHVDHYEDHLQDRHKIDQ